MKFLLVFILLVLFGGCDRKSTAPYIGKEFPFSFNTDMEEWEAKGTDLDDPPIEWSIEISEEKVKDGKASVKFFLNNLNDKGKIWIEREFDLKASMNYQVSLSFAFASADFGEINNFKIITGVHKQPPQTRDDLTFQGLTGNGYDSDVGFVWLDKSYDFNIQANSEGKLYVSIGVWGTFEGPRTYYVDSINIIFVEKH